jgi:inosine-uridine nucleoside N-ribohydrolase
MMRRLFSVLLLTAGLGLAAPPIPLIFDTDMGNDIDDALALSILHSFESRGEVKLLAVTVTKDNPWAPRFVSAVNTFYGRGSLPVGMVKNGVTKDDGNYLRQTLEGGKYPYSEKTEDAVALLRRVLASQNDGSVVIVQVGFSTNLARLLTSVADSASPLSGKDLVARKVRILVTMAGWFPNGAPEYNVKEDIPAAKTVFGQWPTPLVSSGFEIGKVIKYPAVSIERDFAWAPNHPVAEAYRHYMKFPYDRETWDLTAVLYAVRPDRGYFGLTEAGAIKVLPDGKTVLEPVPGGRQRVLTVNAEQITRIREAFVYLASEPVRR